MQFILLHMDWEIILCSRDLVEAHKSVPYLSRCIHNSINPKATVKRLEAARPWIGSDRTPNVNNSSVL